MAVAMVAEGASVEEVVAVAAMVEVGGEMAMAEEAEMAKEGSVCQPHWVGLAVVGVHTTLAKELGAKELTGKVSAEEMPLALVIETLPQELEAEVLAVSGATPATRSIEAVMAGLVLNRQFLE